MAQKAISLPFSFDASGAVAFTSDEAKVWQDRVVLMLMTRLGERIMRPTYGSEIQTYLFENDEGAAASIRKSVSAAFSKWLPQLQLLKVDAYSDKTDGYLMIEVFYKYNPRQNEQRVKLKTAILTRTGEVILEVSD
jgi:phage baseplate assembly protein W